MVTLQHRLQALRARKRGSLGFTLIEMILVVAIMGILLALAVPNYRTTVQASREAVLRDDLFQLRSLISQYTLDKQEAPQSLDDLVSAGYLRQIPVDPFTNSSSTWRTTTSDDLMSPDQSSGGGIVDVHSGASGVGLDGTPYSSW
jgi:general secretion pathway protein G